MYRYFLILLSFVSVFSMKLSAQHAVGSWEVYSNYGIDRADILDTKSRVYFCGGGSLFHYDKELDEMYSYNLSNGLSDVNVSAIYRNYDRDYIVTVYDNSNMDVVYDDGRIVNLSDIKDAQYVSDKTVNNISFDGDEMYVATGFGLVRYDLTRNAVKESGIFSFPVYGATTVGEHVVISTDTGLYCINKSQRINDFTKYAKLSDRVCTAIMPMNDTVLATWQPSENRVNVYNIDFDANTISPVSYGSWVFYGDVRFKRFGDYSGLTVGSQFFVFRLNADNRLEYKDIKLPASLYSTGIYMNGNANGADNDLWYINDYGLGHLTYGNPYLQITDANNYTIDKEPSYPMGTSIHGGPTRLAMSDLGLYVTYNSHGRYPGNGIYTNLLKINLLNNGFIEDKTPVNGDFTTVNG